MTRVETLKFKTNTCYPCTQQLRNNELLEAVLSFFCVLYVRYNDNDHYIIKRTNERQDKERQ